MHAKMGGGGSKEILKEEKTVAKGHISELKMEITSLYWGITITFLKCSSPEPNTCV